jgi:hypothetical protein
VGGGGAGRARTGQLTQPNSITLDATALLSCSLLYNSAHSAWPRLQLFLTTRQGCKNSSQTVQPRLKRFFIGPLREEGLQGYPIKGLPRLQVFLTAKTIFWITHSRAKIASILCNLNSIQGTLHSLAMATAASVLHSLDNIQGYFTASSRL